MNKIKKNYLRKYLHIHGILLSQARGDIFINYYTMAEH